MTALTPVFVGCSQADKEPTFEGSRRFAGKIEGNWEYGHFRECGTLKGCSIAVKSCGYTVAGAAKADWNRLLANESDRSYWIEFLGRKRPASRAEALDNLDPQECVIEVEKLLTACESASPIYPDERGKLPACASSASRR